VFKCRRFEARTAEPLSLLVGWMGNFSLPPFGWLVGGEWILYNMSLVSFSFFRLSEYGNNLNSPPTDLRESNSRQQLSKRPTTIQFNSPQLNADYVGSTLHYTRVPIYNTIQLSKTHHQPARHPDRRTTENDLPDYNPRIETTARHPSSPPGHNFGHHPYLTIPPTV